MTTETVALSPELADKAHSLICEVVGAWNTGSIVTQEVRYAVRAWLVAVADEAARKQPAEPPALPVPCWCPYCDQPHTPRIQLEDPSGPTKPCSCPDTTASACGVERGSKLGKLWHCRRQQLTKEVKP